MKRVAALLTVGLVAVIASPSAAYQHPGTTTLVSVSSSGRHGTGGCTTAVSNTTPPFSWEPSISADGRYVAFASCAQDLVPGDSNAAADIFLHDMATGKTTLVSTMLSEKADIACSGPNSAQFPAISSNGRYIAYQTCAVDPRTDMNPYDDIYVYDRITRTTRIASVTPNGIASTYLTGGGSFFPTISADGRYVAFLSTAQDLVSGKLMTGYHVYVRDMKRNTTRLVDASAGIAPPLDVLDGLLLTSDSYCPSISPTGRYVVFYSGASDLVPGDTNQSWDWFLRDMKTGKTERVSVASDGSQGQGQPGPLGSHDCSNEGGWAPVISRDGRFVTFPSEFPNLVPNDTNNSYDVFVRDRRLHRTERVDVTSAGEENRYATSPTMTPDGRYVAMGEQAGSEQDCLANGKCPHGVYVYDRKLGEVVLASTTTDGSSAIYENQWLAADDRHLAFWSPSTNLVHRATCDQGDIFVRDLGPELGAGELEVGGRPSMAGAPSFASTGVAAATDASGDLGAALTKDGANLIGASLAFRPQLHDLFARIELRDMPMFAAANPALVYGVDVTVHGVRYEIRAAKTGIGAVFGLFRRNALGLWTKVAELRGGYGTTGDEVVFSVPLRDLGLEHAGRLSHVRAFTALGTFGGGPATVLDRVRLR